MSITVHLFYKGENGNAQKFAQEMESSGVAEAIRQEPGNLRYDYFISMKDPETVLLVDSWENQEAIDIHHDSPMMAQLGALREKYDLHMEAERFVEDSFTAHDTSFIRK
ncbi:MAG: antibiotic biosynthesis monooxygenase [Firmicutes bacterium]|nr:antibiotic biosynthesis monooxygenase [Bacillota bacterium]